MDKNFQYILAAAACALALYLLVSPLQQCTRLQEARDRPHYYCYIAPFMGRYGLKSLNRGFNWIAPT